MKHRIAFIGFRHPHILSLYQFMKKRSDCEIIASCELDPATRESLQTKGEAQITHTDYAQMLEEARPAIVAIGDVYAHRGALAITALKAGAHVIIDKPICTSLKELEEITKLSAEKKLAVGCQLDLIEKGIFHTLRKIVQSGAIGDVCTLTLSAQHPLRYGTRAGWYFEPGKHGGTIHDIGIHVFHLAGWLTQSEWKTTLMAREWNAKAKETPHFKDCAQFYGVLTNGVSCYADLSYLAPNHLGYELPQYWRVTVHGTKGVAETSYNETQVTVITDEDRAPQKHPVLSDKPGEYLQNFLDEIAGRPNAEGLTTAKVLQVARHALNAQQKAEQTQ